MTSRELRLNDEYIFEGDITNEVILKWAYDENMLLLEQDEDLVAGHREFFPALFQAANDPECPKGDYALLIMDFYLMFQVLKGDESSISIVEEAISFCEKSSLEKIQEWQSLLEDKVRFIRGVGIVDKTTALAMGRNLLNGISRSCDISIEESDDSWIVELSVPPIHRHKERIFINKDTGKFNFKVSYSGG